MTADAVRSGAPSQCEWPAGQRAPSRASELATAGRPVPPAGPARRGPGGHGAWCDSDSQPGSGHGTPGRIFGTLKQVSEVRSIEDFIGSARKDLQRCRLGLQCPAHARAEFVGRV